METVSCNFCGQSKFDIVHKINVSTDSLKYFRYSKNIPYPEVMTGQFSIVRCKNCDLVFTNPRLDSKQLDLYYSSNRHMGGIWDGYFHLFNNDTPDDLMDLQTFNCDDGKKYYEGELWKYDLVKKYHEKFIGKKNSETTVLDLGCGYGSFVQIMQDNGFQIYGCDNNPERVKISQTFYPDTHIQKGNISDLYPDIKFDIITLWDVIEHVRDPMALLHEVKGYLAKGGLLFIYTMSLDSITYKIFRKHWYYIDPIGHLFYFSDRTMKNYLERAGFVYLCKEMDDSESLTYKDFLMALKVGIMNHLVFHAYMKKGVLAKLVMHWICRYQGNTPTKKILQRFQSLYPYILPLRYKDDFVYISRNTDSLNY